MRAGFHCRAAVRVFDGVQLTASLARRYDKGRQIEEPAHIAERIACKRAARRHRGMDRLSHAAPASTELLVPAGKRNGNLGTITMGLLRLLDRFGSAELQAARQTIFGKNSLCMQ